MTPKEFATYCGCSIQWAETRMKEIGCGEIYFRTKDHKGQRKPDLYMAMASHLLPDATRILEIGTGTGTATILMCKLWPKAQIYTWDLPDNHFDVGRMAIRKKGIPEAAEFEQAIRMPNVNYVSSDSFLFHRKKGPKEDFDIVYVDGNHHYPCCAWDIYIGYNIVKPGGLVFFDDIGGENHVADAITWIRNIIPEKIEQLPWADYRRKVSWGFLRKQ